MRTVIPVASQKTRLGPLTNDTPKAIVEVNRRLSLRTCSTADICDTNDYIKVIEVTRKLENLPTNLVMTIFHTSLPAIFKSCHPVQSSDRNEYELPDAIDLLIQLGQTIDTLRMDGWRVNIGYPEDRNRDKAHWKSKPADT
jgi:glucose-1-phosphate thymidylyltransferase